MIKVTRWTDANREIWFRVDPLQNFDAIYRQNKFELLILVFFDKTFNLGSVLAIYIQLNVQLISVYLRSSKQFYMQFLRFTIIEIYSVLHSFLYLIS